jgi:hypothetical protein
MIFWIFTGVIFFLMVLFVAVGPLVVVIHYRKQVAEMVDHFTKRWFWAWIGKGLAAPILLCLLLCLGSMPAMPPLTRSIAHLRNAGTWGHALLAQIRLVAIIVNWYWAALTLGWFVSALVRRAKNYDDLLIAGFFWAFVLIPILACTGYIFGWGGIGFGAVLWLWPFTHYALDKAIIRQHSPTYGRAIGKMKFGKYGEAELAIIAELEHCENDFDGWMMLAELYANQFHDVDEAARTIYELCAEPTTTLSQISIALHRLADWHLKLRGDPVAARRVLAEISTRMPGTHLDRMARNRLNQIADSREEFARQQEPRHLPLPALSESHSETPATDAPPINPEEALATANQCVEKLKLDPNDVAAREKLAHTFAEQLGQVDLGIEQIELLMNMAEQPPAKMAEWIGLLAAWQAKYRKDAEAARKLLQRLVQEYPQSPQAFAAQRQLILMERRLKIQR